MPAAIPENYKDLFEKKAFASLATLMPDGQPQVTPVWCDFDGSRVVINSAQGRVVEITENGADQHIEKMAKKYLGQDKYPFRQPGEVRVIYKIEPDRVATMG